MGRLFDNTIKTGQLSFILFYKISQDHIEMLFLAIRLRGGFNSNSTAGQFEATYKKLLVHSELSISENANCSPQDSTTIFHVTSTKKIQVQSFLDILCVEEEESFLEDNEQQNNEPEEINVYKEDVIEHIAGFVVRQLYKIINCSVCCSALDEHILIYIKNRGGLKKPSIDVINICKVTVKVFNSRVQDVSKHLENPVTYFTIKTMAQININNLFPSLSIHIASQSPINNHLLQIIQLIIKKYIVIRLHHYNKEQCQPKSRIRSQLTKQILFQHQ